MEKMNFTDKITGIILEPDNLFTRLSQHKPRVSDWFLAILIYIFITSICNVIIQNNQEIKQLQFREKIEKVEKDVENRVQTGRMSRQEANSIIDEEYRRNEFLNAGPGLVWSFIGTFVFTFLGFFIFVLITLFILNSTFAELYKLNKTLLAIGLPFYILALEPVLSTLVSLILKKNISNLSLDKFLPFREGYIAFIIGFINPVKIWYIFLISLGLKKFHNSRRFYKYPGMFIGVILFVLSVFYWLFSDYFILFNKFI